MIRSFCSFYDIDYKGAICKDDFNRDAFRDNVTVKELGYFISKIRYKLHVSNKEIISQYFRKNGMKIGGGVQHLLQYNDFRTLFNSYW